MNKKIELLSPAGSLEKLKIALLYGADACYIGGYKYSLRANAINFSIDEIKEACDFAHSLNKLVYVTINIVFHNEELVDIISYLKDLEEAKVDAVILSDPMLIDVIRDNNIKLAMHISTQASSLNYETVNFWKNNGVERVVLARELHEDEIKDIINTTGIEIETFIHGAMCSSYSGRCVLSNYFTNRDANRGGCAQICRWTFKLCDSNKLEIADESCPLFSLAVKDLSLINEIEDMINIGIASLKIEGRMRSNYYVATVVSTYREAIDNYYNNTLTKDKIKKYEKVLNRVANRDSKEQFFKTFPKSDGNYYLGRCEVSNQDYLGLVLDYDEENNLVILTQRNYFTKNMEVEFFGPNIETFSFKIDTMYDCDDNIIEIANHPEQIVKIKIDKKLYKNDIMRIKL